MLQINDTPLGAMSSQKKIKIAVLLIAVGVYLGIILFGENSVISLININNEKNDLNSSIVKLKEENQKLQHDYFELKQLEPKGVN